MSCMGTSSSPNKSTISCVAPSAASYSNMRLGCNAQIANICAMIAATQE